MFIVHSTDVKSVHLGKQGAMFCDTFETKQEAKEAIKKWRGDNMTGQSAYIYTISKAY